MSASAEYSAYLTFFRALGHRLRAYRTERGLSQEDMLSFGFSVRHWQMMEAGRPMNLVTLLRIAEAFGVPPETLLDGLGSHLGRSSKRSPAPETKTP